MTRKQVASQYLGTVRDLLEAVTKKASSGEARRLAMEKFRADVNPLINQYLRLSKGQSIANEFSDERGALKLDERKELIYWESVQGLTRAGKEAAVSDADLSAHYLKCALGLGELWLESID